MRPSWEEYYLGVAQIISLRSTCPRLQVGAVLTHNNVIISTGFNGAPSGMLHCDEVGCQIVNNHCLRTIHAELNSIIRAHTTIGGILYTTHFPCIECCKAIINARVKELYYAKTYSDDRCKYFDVQTQQHYLENAGIYVASKLPALLSHDVNRNDIERL